MVARGARNGCAENVDRKIADVCKLRDQLLAREVRTSALQRFDQHLGASNSKQIEDGQAVSRKFCLDEFAPLFHFWIGWGVLHHRNCPEFGGRSGNSYLILECGRIANSSLADQQWFKAKFLCVAGEYRGGFRKKHHDNGVCVCLL